MNPDFLYFIELALDDNNKFVLDFSDGDFIQKINFNKNFNCYTASLDCNLILKEHIKKDKKKKKYKNYLEKADFYLKKEQLIKMILGFLTTNSNGLFNIPFSGLTYHFKLLPHTLYDSSFSYKFFDTIEKKIRDYRIYCHSCIFITMGLNFREYYCLQEKRMFQ